MIGFCSTPCILVNCNTVKLEDETYAQASPQRSVPHLMFDLAKLCRHFAPARFQSVDSQRISTQDSRSDSPALVLDLLALKRPVVVDLDGTLTKTDTLHESIIQLVKRSPLRLLGLLFTLLKGKAAFKNAIAAQVDLDVTCLPYRQDFLEYLRKEKSKGRRIILATAAHQSIADKVAAHLGLFDEVLASNGGLNLKGAAKLAGIRDKLGSDFCYAGDSKADLTIWSNCSSAILAGASPQTTRAAKGMVAVEREFVNEGRSLKIWLRALRVHQWLKNLLIFVPVLTSFSFISDISNLILACVAFASFSIAASGTYILNDLWDLENDRQHTRKRNRPFANATLPIHHGLAVAAGTLITALFLSLLVSSSFAVMLVGYVVLTTSYSLLLKSYVLIDVLLLSLLYTFRILAGSAATGIPVSAWLLAFSVFLFLSLALVKRCAELVALTDSGKAATRGRDYQVTDLTVLWPMGVGAALSAIVVFGLFISSTETQSRYASPQLLWLVAIGLLYWTGRLWVKTARGEMHDDPVVYAAKDRSSLICLGFMAGTMGIAHLVKIGPWV